MPRSATTAAYTRVDNSFSNPVVGTTISPSDADTFFDDVQNAMNAWLGTSTTSQAITTGAVTLTIANNVGTKAFLAGMSIHAFSLSNTANFMDATVTSYNTSTGALVLSVFANGGSGTVTDWVIISSGARGATGATGATGSTGATGAQGTSMGLPWAFSTTTTMADPSSGNLRLNNATVASATAIAISATNSASGSSSAWINTFDDSSNTAHRGTLTIKKKSDENTFAQFDITGATTDNTTWLQLAVTYLGGNGTLANSDAVVVSFARAGNKGADGTNGTNGTNGATSITGTPTANQLATFSDATTIQGVSITGLVKGNGASAPTAAVAGTDYQAADTQLFSNVPQNSKSAAYTTVLTDGEKCIFHPAADTTARTWTIDSNANVAYPIGTVIGFSGESGSGVITLAITSDTLVWLPSGSTGSRTLTAPFLCAAMKVTATKWFLVGTGIS